MSVPALLATSSILVGATYFYHQGHSISTEEFLAAGRDTGTVVGAITILATWSAAPAILIPAQLGYARGLPTALWFTIPNALTLILFGVVAVQIKKRFPSGYTIAEIFGNETSHIHSAVTMLTLAKSFVAVSMSVVGGATFLTFFSELGRNQSVLIILGTILAYSLISGLNASIFTDVLQTIAFAVLYVVFIPWSISAGDGIAVVIGAIRDGAIAKMFTGSNIEFGLILVILLFTAPIVSQYIWQRAYAIQEENTLGAFTIAGLGFFFVPAGMAVLGLIVADSGTALDNPLLASYAAMNQAVPASASLILFLLLLTTLLSAADSALVACASIISVDLLGTALDRDIEKTRTSRYAMVAISVVVAIAAMGPFNMLDWVMLNAPIGAVLTIPVLVYLYTPDVADTTYTTAALIIGSLIAFPLYIYGTIQGNDGYRLGGLVGALVVTAVLVYVIPSLRRDKSAPVAN